MRMGLVVTMVGGLVVLAQGCLKDPTVEGDRWLARARGLRIIREPVVRTPALVIEEVDTEAVRQRRVCLDQALRHYQQALASPGKVGPTASARHGQIVRAIDGIQLEIEECQGLLGEPRNPGGVQGPVAPVARGATGRYPRHGSGGPGA